jgi:hypothetical protein
VTSAAGGRRKTLTRSPVGTVVQREVAEAQRSARSGKSAKRTDAGIRSGLHRLAAYAASPQSVKPAKKDRRPRG